MATKLKDSVREKPPEKFIGYSGGFLASAKIFSKNFEKGVTNRPAQTLYKQKEKNRFLLTKNEYYDIL